MKLVLKFEVSHGKNLEKFEGRKFITCQKGNRNLGADLSARFRRKFWKLRLKLRVFFLETSFSRKTMLSFFALVWIDKNTLLSVKTRFLEGFLEGRRLEGA